MMPPRTTWLVLGCLLLVTAARARGAGPAVIVTPVAVGGQLLVSFDLNEGLSPELREAIRSGLPTALSYDIELRRSAAWFDQTIARVTLDARVRFDNLSRQYALSRTVNGQAQPAGATEDEETMRRWMCHVERLPIASTAALETHRSYYVRIRVDARPRTRWIAWPWDGQALGRAAVTFVP
jgi:hypothetical protein